MIAMMGLVCVAAVLSPTVCAQDTPPLYQITASTLHAAGLVHGRLAAKRIEEWLGSEEMTNLADFVTHSGLSAFNQLKQENSAKYPQYAEELLGISEGATKELRDNSEGAGISLDSIWMLNLANELEILMDNEKGHCSDVSAVAAGGPQMGFTHGHNEDWSGPVKKLWYFLQVSPAEGADFEGCAGFVYPGNVLGFAPTWNAHGLYVTQNSVFPKETRPVGVASIFATRDAICGSSGSKGLEAVAAQLTTHAWSSGASINLVDLKAQRMANVEVYEDSHSFVAVPSNTGGGNSSHFNAYKHLRVGELNSLSDSTIHRQARVDALPPPRTRADVIQRLSDTEDSEYPIFRDVTLTTMILDGLTGHMDVWCCGRSAAGDTAPIYSWKLLSFFDSSRRPPVQVEQL